MHAAAAVVMVVRQKHPIRSVDWPTVFKREINSESRCTTALVSVPAEESVSR